MEYITSRRFELPQTAAEMRTWLWFSMWRTKQWPYRDLDEGDILFWYESPSQRIVWKSRVLRVEQFCYRSKAFAAQQITNSFGDPNVDQPYFVEAPEEGYCVVWNVEPLGERLNIAKPTGFRMPMLGWQRLGVAGAEAWTSLLV